MSQVQIPDTAAIRHTGERHKPAIIRGTHFDLMERKITRGPFKGYKITFADQTQTERLRENVDKILWLVAKHMGWEDISHVFVSDLSSFSDFCMDKDAIADIRQSIGIDFDPRDHIIDIAMRMNKPQ